MSETPLFPPAERESESRSLSIEREPRSTAAADALFASEVAALRPLVTAVVRKTLGSRSSNSDVDDCASEAIRRALEGRAKAHAIEATRPWLLGVARHVALDHLRSLARAKRRLLPEGDEAYALEGVADPRPLQDTHFEGRELQARVEAAMQTLPPDTRRALLLFHGRGLSYQAVAEEMGVPLGSVATWISRGRKALAAAWAANEKTEGAS